MQTQFYVSHNGEDLGPFTKEEMQSKISSKELFPSDYVFVEEKDDWVVLGDFLGTRENAKVVTPKKHELKNELPKVELKRSTPPPIELEKTVIPTTPKTSVVSSTETSSHIENGTVRFSHGEAAVSVKNDKVGTVTVTLVDTAKLGLDVSTKAQIKFTAGPAAQIAFDAADSVQAGQPLKINFRALDKYGNLDVKFTGSIKVDSKMQGASEVKFLGGLGSVELKATKAESVEIKFSNVTHQQLQLKSLHKLHIKPAPASKMLVETKGEATVGEDVMIHVKAVDAYGNLDVNFNNTITVKLDGAVSKDAEIRLTKGTGSFKVS